MDSGGSVRTAHLFSPHTRSANVRKAFSEVLPPPVPENALRIAPDICRESLAKVDVPEAVGELEGAAEGEVALASDRSRHTLRGTRREHSTTI